MRRSIYLVFILFCLSCGKEELPPRETTLLEAWEVEEVLSNWFGSYSQMTQFINEWVGFRTGPMLYKTRDGGRNFDGIFLFPYSPTPPAVFALDEQQIWITFTRIEEDEKSSQGIVYRSKDGGDTWEVFERKNTFFERMSFSSSTRGFAHVIEYDGSGTEPFELFQTEDGGATWFRMEGVDLSRVSFQQIIWKTQDLGFIVGLDGAHYRTLDGGKTWTPFRSNPSGTESIFYPIDADRYYDFRFSETVLGNWADRTEVRLDQPIYVLSHIGDEVLGLLLEEGCPPYTPCKNWLMSSQDGGKTWEKHRGVPFDIPIRRDQEVRPGVVLISDYDSSTLVRIRKK
ncbi:MAG: hypothetical protein EP311_03915 [Cytophagales bacterium]|nr:MAG: hypothetical protein EP311_03915 [Cytophagales bacterium]